MGTTIAPAEIAIEGMILTVRGQKVILAADLARLYGVTTRALNQAVRRNSDRFPEDFFFQLTAEEKQEVITNCDHLENLKYSSVPPYAFTEHGTIMAANLLNSPRAVEVSVFIVRAFVELRKAASTQREILRRLAELEKQSAVHGQNIGALADAIRKMIASPPATGRRQVGFHWEDKPAKSRSRKKKQGRPAGKRRRPIDGSS